MNAKTFASQVQDLFELPDTFLRLQSLQNSDSSTLNDYAEIISLDPSLAARVLKLSNSVLYRFPSQIDTLTQAINVIGSEAVIHLALANCTGNVVNQIAKGTIDIDRFWNESVECALLMRNLGIMNGTKRHERLFIIGLLHNIGELVVAQVAPEKASEIEKMTRENANPLENQRQVLGFNYADCSAELVTAWKLPDNLVIPIRFQHIPLQTNVFNKETSLLHISNALVSLISNAQPVSELSESVSKLAAREGLEEEDLSKSIEYTNLEALEVLSILNPGAASII
ncbi:MAG: HDOD domain-containing protein [Hahellaceae bacterium]|nr:HDOD domain-containing protein [Hahellaceae bacterium]